jgi:hypothetical protein
MPAEKPTNNKIAAEVRSLRMPIGTLPLARLARHCGTPASTLCDWERGRKSLRPSVQRQVRAIVRSEFAKHVVRVAELAARHGIAAG